MTTIVKAAGAAQFLSLVPRMLGFTPTESLVLVPFDGTRTLGVMRFDLPPATVELDAFASTSMGLVCRVEYADAVAVVVYTGAPYVAGPPRDDLFRALLTQVDACGLDVADALCVAGDAWGSYLDAECPPGGRPLDDLDVDPAPGIDLAPAHGDQSTGAELPAVDPADLARIELALPELRRAIATVLGGALPGGVESDVPLAEEGHDLRVDPQALIAACFLEDLPTFYERVLREDPVDIGTYRMAALVWCLARPAVRDVALVQWCSGITAGDEALEAQLRWEDGEPYPTHLALRMWGEGVQPDPDRLRTALEVTRWAAAVAPRHDRPGPLAMCAWLSWALGRSTHAGAYAELALEIDPAHGLSEIVLTYVGSGHLPDWAFQRGGAR